MTSNAYRAFAAGLLIALGFQFVQAQAFEGDWTGLLGVGTASRLAPFITTELGEVALWNDVGHDGQINFAIARDVAAHKIPPLLDHGGYRYRRILYPALAGLGGLLPPNATLVGLIVWASIGIGLTAAAGALLAETLGLWRWIWMPIILSPGIWLSTQLLTSDALGFGLALLAIALWLIKRPGWALVLLALASLAKDQFVLIGLVLAFWEFSRGNRRTSFHVALASAAPLLTWSLAVELRIGGGLSPRKNFDWPLMGILGSAQGVWPMVEPKDVVFTAVALGGVVLALVGGALVRQRLLRWSAWAWATVGVLASSWVWDLGNNAVRALAPALAFGILAIGHRLSDHSRELEIHAPTTSRRNLAV